MFGPREKMEIFDRRDEPTAPEIPSVVLRGACLLAVILAGGPVFAADGDATERPEAAAAGSSDQGPADQSSGGEDRESEEEEEGDAESEIDVSAVRDELDEEGVEVSENGEGAGEETGGDREWLERDWLWDFTVDLTYSLIGPGRGEFGGRVHVGALRGFDRSALVFGLLRDFTPRTGSPQMGVRAEYHLYGLRGLGYVDTIVDLDGHTTLAFGAGSFLLGIEFQYRPGPDHPAADWAGLARLRIPISGLLTVVDKRTRSSETTDE